MKKEPLLSICVATYNRAHYLKNCLMSVYIQLENNELLQNEIEIVISDNASIDNTEEVSMSYADKFKHFYYNKNETNVGFDLNVLNVVTKASGKYCWYLGDDDLISNGAIEYIFNLLKTNKYDFIGTGSKPENFINDKITKINITSTLLETTDINECYFNGYCQGGFSVLIFNRDRWLESVNVNDYLWQWLYYETILKLIGKSNKKFAYAPDNLVITGQDCRWAENGTELYTYINSNILKTKMMAWGYDIEKIENELLKNSNKLPIVLLRAKGHNLSFEIKHLKYIIGNMKSSGFLRLTISSILFFIPNGIVRFVRDLKKKILK